MTEKPKLLIASIEDSAEGQAKLATLAAGGYRPIVGGLVYHPPLGDFPFITAIFAHHEVDEARTEAYEAENNLAEGQMANYEARIAELETRLNGLLGMGGGLDMALAKVNARIEVLEAAASAKAREAFLRTLDPMQTYRPPEKPTTPQPERDATRAHITYLTNTALLIADLALDGDMEGVRKHRANVRYAANQFKADRDENFARHIWPNRPAQPETTSQPAPERDRNIVARWHLPTRSNGPFLEMRYAADQSLIDHLVGDTFRIVEWRLEAQGKSGEPEIVLVLEVTPEAQQEAANAAHPARKVEDAEPQPAAEPTITLPRTALDDWYMRFALASVTGVMDGSTRKGFNDLLIEIAALIEEHGS